MAVLAYVSNSGPLAGMTDMAVLAYVNDHGPLAGRGAEATLLPRDGTVGRKRGNGE